MENKTILITGANGGLGQAFIHGLLEQNPKKIYCAARNLKSVEAFKDLSSVIEIIELDITDKDSISNAVAKIDTLDLLINNAGVNTNSRLYDNNFLDIEVNLKGTVNVTEVFFDKLKESQGKVVNITSILALVNFPLMANYAISKSALHSFTQALRAEFTLFGGEVYEVLPGPIETRMTEGFPMPKAKPEDIVKCVIEAIKSKDFEIYPDGFSQMVQQRLESEPQKIIEEFANAIAES
ncbi:SDR family NAD(P)-dependent oxidoreductase [Sulfurovum sp. zt1-1]|uniref:SDR family NAD(P)-dependent oxidoreductase n=1 Tax=Sulfurovum zhangzhouensis TaxID=3019067 RepID=A0ABT7QVP6_9BACT|nr:SDR family NAD(P)-dependent oxidoreductase [Sulfurovum zhangzhouensis]MDM5270914.1 SDR family NAD(P)-dependent oxidoreductase [Sulfurovum zhangzhouensis]